MIAARHTMFGPEAGIKPPYDWSYNTVMDQRDALAAKVARSSSPIVTDAPSIDLSALGVTAVQHHPVPLTQYPGKIGMLFRYTATPNNVDYCIVDPEAGTVTRTGAYMTSSSTNAASRLCMDRNGNMCGAVRHDGGIYSWGQDGSNCTKHGVCEAFPTNRGFRLVQIPEGGFIAYGEESTTRHMYKIDDNYNISLAFTWGQTSYYPYSAIFMPNYLITTATTALICRFARNLSSGSPISTGTFGSYSSLHSITMCPLTRGDIFFGMMGHTISGKKVVGYKADANTAVTSSLTAPEQCENVGCFLPTGEFFSHSNYTGSNASHPPLNANQWYLYNYETDTFTNVGGTHDGTNNVGWRVFMLPTGKCLSYRSTFGTDGKINFKFHDWGFKKRDIPANLISGPYGFNNTCC